MKKFLALLLCSTLVLSSSTYAESAKPVKVTEVKEFPFHFNNDTYYHFKLDGWAFSEDQEKKIRLRLIDADYFEKEIKLLKDNEEHYKRMLELEKQISLRYQNAWKESDESLTKVLKREGRTKIWYLLLGIGLTIGAGFAMSQAGR